MFQSSFKSEAVYTNLFPFHPVDGYWSPPACLLGNMNKIQNPLLYFSFTILSKKFIHQVYMNLHKLDVFWNTLIQCLCSLAPVLAEPLDSHLICDTVILTRCHAKSERELLAQISGYWPTLILFKSCGIMISSVSYNTSYPFIHPSILTIHMLKSAFVCSNSPDCDNSANDVTWHPTCWGFFILR